MHPKNLRVGATYRNRGKGRVTRTILGIGDEHRPKLFFSPNEPPDEPGVYYRDSKGREGRLYVSSFASWAGGEVEV